MKELKRQDKNGTRTTTDIERRYKLQQLDPTIEEVEELKKTRVVDDYLSTTSVNPVQNKVITRTLNNKVNKETGKGLSENDFTDVLKLKLDELENYDDTELLNRLSMIEDKESDWNLAKTRTDKTEYNLSSYKVNELTISRSSCIKKNNRVVVNFVGTINIPANVATTLFNLPEALIPSNTKDFVCFGTDSSDEGYIGYGYVTEEGIVQVRFSTDISSYIRFNLVYDLD